MLETFTIAISHGALGLLAGAFVPVGVAYSVFFVRRHGSHLRTFLRLGGRLLAAILVTGGIVNLGIIGARLLGSSGELETIEEESIPYIVGTQIGLWGGMLALAIGISQGGAGIAAQRRLAFRIIFVRRIPGLVVKCSAVLSFHA